VSALERDPAVAQTQAWLERLVIGQGLCPFAAGPYREGRIAYSVCDADSLEGIYETFLHTLEALVLADPAERETALLIVSRGLSEFDDYLDVLSLLEQAVVEAGLEGVIQLASFHPGYRFEGVQEGDPANYSNRSPLPMFHLIREHGLAEALATYPDPERIPERNVRRLRELGVDGILSILRGERD